MFRLQLTLNQKGTPVKTPVLYIISFIGFCGLSSSNPAFAHAEHDKSRYVAEDGKDEGRCDQIAAPCKTIAYAAKQAGKGDRILVAEGRYEITDVDSIFYLSSSAVSVSGGYQKNTFQKTSAASNKTTLIGVPSEFAEGLAEKGFTVIADTKGLNHDQQILLASKESQLATMNSAQTRVDCVAGDAGGFPCNNLDLLAHVPLSTLGNTNSHGNDIWGHYDVNDGREYALMGLTNGVSVVEVTDPLNPRVVSFVPSQNTVWRDLKTYQYYDNNRRRWMSYAYVTADNASVGTMILDLNQLPEKVVQVSSENSDASAHNIYISNVNYSTGIALTNRTPYMHIAGSDKQNGAFNTYSLTDPLHPVSVYKNAANSRSWYSHDVSSLWITDERRSQCQDTAADCDLLLDFNENEFLLWDKTNHAAPTNLSHTSYPNVSYVHSGWWTEDKQFISVHDELDEQRFSLNTHVRFFAINNLRAPEFAGEYIGPTTAIDHNGFVRGNRYYMSNYERGLVVLDISNPRNPTEVGFFDTYPLANSASFNGAWGAYPFLPSGNILVSDINSGLYIIRDKTGSTQGRVKFSVANLSVNEGETAQLILQRVDGSAGIVGVYLETQSGNATDAIDYSSVIQHIEWLDGDTTDKLVEIPITADGEGNEFTETFFVRLYNPRNGLSLTAPNMMQIAIRDKADELVSSSSQASSSAPGSSPSSPPGSSTKKSGGGGSISYWLLVFFLSLYALRLKKNESSIKKHCK